MSADALLSCLDRVKQTGQGRWLARCPAHEDKTPSLSIREMDDGRVLINCFGGCGALDVLDALGLQWAALFPPKSNGHYTPPTHSRIPARDLLTLLDHEVTVLALILADVLKERAVDESQWTRLAQAAARIGEARDHGRA